MFPSASYLLACAAIAIAPGPDILFVLGTGMARGRTIAVVAAAGFASGLTVHTTAVVCGLSALLMASASAFACVKFAGAAYLLYLGIQALRSKGGLTLRQAEAAPPARIYARAFLMNVLNPKVAMFFLAFLPQFTNPAKGSLAGQLILLGATLAVVAFCIFSLVGVFSSALGGWLRARPQFVRGFDWAIGALFVSLGLRLALATRR